MTKKQAARPSIFTHEFADQICDQLASGMTLREICRAQSMPDERTVRRWALDNREGFAEKYSRAREIGYHSMADEMLEIADDGSNDWMMGKDGSNQFYAANGEHIQRSRLRLDTRKWLLSKALPKIYGDKLPVESNTEPQMVVHLLERSYEGA
jgi:hypothetical protein